MLETRDGGQHWRSLGDDLASVPWFNDVAVDPLAPYLVYAATPWGLFRLDTSQELTAVAETGTVPQRFALAPNYPNPFNPGTTIRFSLPVAAVVTLEVYDTGGQKVATLLNGEPRAAGSHAVRFDASALASGVYFCRLEAGAFHQVRKMTVLR